MMVSIPFYCNLVNRPLTSKKLAQYKEMMTNISHCPLKFDIEYIHSKLGHISDAVKIINLTENNCTSQTFGGLYAIVLTMVRSMLKEGQFHPDTYITVGLVRESIMLHLAGSSDTCAVTKIHTSADALSLFNKVSPPATGVVSEHMLYKLASLVPDDTSEALVKFIAEAGGVISATVSENNMWSLQTHNHEVCINTDINMYELMKL